MAVPGSNPVPFVPASGQFYVDSVTSLTGTVLGTIIDVDQGFKVNGASCRESLLADRDSRDGGESVRQSVRLWDPSTQLRYRAKPRSRPAPAAAGWGD